MLDEELAAIRARSDAHTERLAGLYDSELAVPRDIEAQDTQAHRDVRALLGILAIRTAERDVARLDCRDLAEQLAKMRVWHP